MYSGGNNLFFFGWCREGEGAFCVALVGGDSLVSSALQALAQSICSPEKLRFAIIPIGNCVVSVMVYCCDDPLPTQFLV